MRNKRRYCFLLLGLFGLLLSLFVACGPTGYKTYTNDQFGYTISHPYSWTVEVSADGTKCLLASPTRTGSVMIDVAEAMLPRIAANYLIMSISQSTPGKAIQLIEDKQMEGAWDWYLSYDYETDFGMFHGEAYFKLTDTNLYKLDTAANVAEYKDYPFSTIISSFKLQ